MNAPSEPESPGPDTTNTQLVGRRGDLIVVVMPHLQMTREEALVHAAWLVTLSFAEPGEFEAILGAVQAG